MDAPIVVIRRPNHVRLINFIYYEWKNNQL